MHHWYIFILFVFSFSSLYSQEFIFCGSLLLKDYKTIDYKIKFEVDSSQDISGMSYKYFDDYIDSCYFNGEFDHVNQSFFANEISMSRLQRSFPVSYVANVRNLFGNLYVIAGIYLSSKNDTGHINVLCRNFKIENYNKDKFLVDSNILSLLSSNISKEKTVKKVYSKDKVEIRSSEETVFMKIYDHSIEDGDKISVYINNKLLLKNEILKKKGLLLKLKLQKGNNILTIKAKNEGRIAMNTSKVELYNKSKTLNEIFLNILKKNEENIYEIKY